MSEEKKEFKLFREKSIEAVSSPESLNDYLRVTSPSIWLILAAIVVLLLGVIFWGVFGHIDTTRQVAIVSKDGTCACVVPYESAESALRQRIVVVGDTEYALQPVVSSPSTVTDTFDVNVRITGNLGVGDVVVMIPLEEQLDDGIYVGTLVTERITPMSLLFQ